MLLSLYRFIPPCFPAKTSELFLGSKNLLALTPFDTIKF